MKTKNPRAPTEPALRSVVINLLFLCKYWPSLDDRLGKNNASRNQPLMRKMLPEPWLWAQDFRV